LNEGSVREADFVRESYTAAQKRVQRSMVSCSVHVAIGCGGARDKMRTNSFFS
jgi:gamma-glutamyl:cysteine ligase YbdK (ATP-grasp superfamily)